MTKRKAVKKSKNRRESKKYPALDVSVNLRTRQDLIDYDYINKLSDKDKAWLNKFTEEFINARVDSKNLKKNLHNTEALKKDCYDRNNARNRCILTRTKAQGLAIDLKEMKNGIRKNEEEDLIDQIDEHLLSEFDDFQDSDNESNEDGDPTEQL
jgi:hypothetical protein